MKKRITALILVLVMVLSIAPQVSAASIEDYWRARSPVLLRFCVQEQKFRSFAIAKYTPELFSIDFPQHERIIMLFDGQGQPQTLPVSNKQFFAVRQEDGSHRFFARDGN